MYMTVLKMDRESMSSPDRETVLEIGNGQRLHEWLARQINYLPEEENSVHRGYPESGNYGIRAADNALYRVDRVKNDWYIYVQSDHPIKEDDLARCGIRKIACFEINKPTGRVYFRGLFSVDVAKKDESGASRRLYIKDKEQRIEWLRKRLSVCMDDISIREIDEYSKRNEIVFTRKNIKMEAKTDPKTGEVIMDRETGKTIKEPKLQKERTVRIKGAQLEGTGTVTNPDKFMEIVRQGIGREKNFGMGLILFKEIM